MAKHDESHERERRWNEAIFRMQGGYVYGWTRREPLPLRRMLRSALAIIVIAAILITVFGSRAQALASA